MVVAGGVAVQRRLNSPLQSTATWGLCETHPDTHHDRHSCAVYMCPLMPVGQKSFADTAL